MIFIHASIKAEKAECYGRGLCGRMVREQNQGDV